MKARLKDGRIAELEKDCGCVIHDGPHWVHMDMVLAELNRNMLLSMLGKKALLAFDAFAQEESFRLKDKIYEMEKAGIVELLWSEAEQNFWDGLYSEVKAIISDRMKELREKKTFKE